MTIRVVCPNGHALNVKDSLAGKTGLCPKCKARVVVPEPHPGGLSEDAIMNILATHTPATSKNSRDGQEQLGSDALPPSETEKTSPPKKPCHKCNEQISAGIHICPYCRTYIAGLTDF